MRLQTQSASKPLYRGTWDCVGKTVKKEGVRMRVSRECLDGTRV